MLRDILAGREVEIEEERNIKGHVDKVSRRS